MTSAWTRSSNISLSDERELLRNKAGGRLGLAVMLKYLQWRGRFPRGRHEIPDDAIAHVARQIGASAGDMGFYDVTNRQASSHRAEIRRHTAVRSGGRDMISRDHGTIPA